MYAWVYLTDFLATKRLFAYVDVLQNSTSDQSIISSFDEKFWSFVDRKKVDPRCQLSKGAFETVCYLNAFLFSQERESSTIVELGQTFFTAIDKFEFIHLLSKKCFSPGYQLDQIKWIGIDNSEFCNMTANILHEQKQQNLTIYSSVEELPKQENAIFHSRFVCSYVFKNTKDFAGFLSQNFEFSVIEDAFSTKEQDIHTQNHGQSETFFNLQELNELLGKDQFETYILDYYGDWPAASSQCLVVKLLIVKKGVFDKQKFQKFLNYHGFKNDMIDQSKNNLLENLMSSISRSEWRKIYANKKINPVWGRTSFEKVSMLRKLLKFACDRYRLFREGYRSYNLKGRNAEQEIYRYLNEQNNI